MLLEQIERRQEKLMQDRNSPAPPVAESKPEPQPAAPVSELPRSAKTVGAKVPPDLYEQLERIRDRHKTGSIQKALLLAARKGVERLLGER